MEQRPTARLAVFALFVPFGAIQYAVLLGRDSWTHFIDRFYRTLAPRPDDNRVLGNLTLLHSRLLGAVAFVFEYLSPAGRVHHLHAEGARISLASDRTSTSKSLPIRVWRGLRAVAGRASLVSIATSPKLMVARQRDVSTSCVEQG